MEASCAPEIVANFARLKPEEVGEQIGPYRLMEQIGQGGFGTVWVADQERPVRRRVALKIIKLGMDTREVIARFEQERQALAMMDHPHIAKVLDAGATQWGRPFFVMELVRGIKITDYCDQANLPTADRLALFIQVCHAVQHAHQKGIIHRDLKPSNILVTLHDGVPVPKVIDFGVAKATQPLGRLGDLTIYTQFQQMIGTPLYMSPEQAEMSGLDIDTRSDIYSLGVLLYELLTGRTPCDPEELMRQGLDEIRRTIREQEPLTPSVFLKTMAVATRATVAQHRQCDPEKLAKTVRGDLDWIVMKALEKDRTRRYETANGLALDLKRHLASEPVLAGPPSQLYRMGRFVRRNRLAVAMTGAIAFTLIGAAFFSTWSFLREQEQRRQSDTHRRHATRLLYTSDIYTAQQALRVQNFERARAALDAHRPAPGEPDLRGWEWRLLWQQARGEGPPGESARAFPEHVASVRALPGGRHVIATSGKYGQSLIDLETLRETPLLANPAALTRFAPPKWLGLYDGARLAVHEITADGLRPVGAKTIGPGFSAYFAYSPASGLLAWTSGDGQVSAGPLGSGEKVDLRTDDELDFTVRFSHDGWKLLVSQAVTGAVRVWDVAARRRLSTAERYFSPYEFSLNAFNSVRGRALTDWVTAAAASTATLASLPAAPPPEFWPPGAWNDRAFSPDGRTFAVAAESGVFGIYDNVKQQRITALRGHRQSVFAVAFSADGTRLASVSGGEEAVKLWDVTTGRELLTLTTDETRLDAAEFTDDHSTLLVGRDGRCLFWRAPSWRQIEDAERTGGRWPRSPEK